MSTRPSATAGAQSQRGRLELPPAPAHLAGDVKAWSEPVALVTYQPGTPDANPMFLEKRVYQGSSGRVYPLPFIDCIATEPEVREWQAIHLENAYVRLMILPEIGGRIHVGFDKTTGQDFFYRQNVIKPALVGLAGPWISGGVEFNWPQHHRPATFMPVNTEIEHHPDGAVTVWCSDHDPMLRMKGMHGVCLYPGRALLELKARLYNRTPFTQTFLWWANVATRVHERYQSFFPSDVRFVADHAKRAMTTFPLSDGTYYGVDYAERARTGVPAEEMPAHFVPDGSYPANDLSWYSNIPVPTSYMITGTQGDFFGGYDHARQAGVVHVANHHIAPGKKQWTWGNHDFGYAWDRSLTDADGPYIELMAGVYTDNQPDFSFLAPWETKTFSQHWFPVAAIGVPQAANLDAAVSLRVNGERAEVGVYVTSDLEGAEVILSAGEVELGRWAETIRVADPLLRSVPLASGGSVALTLTVFHAGRALITYDPRALTPAGAPRVAEEPAPPAELGSVEELYLTGLHLEQYRHATRLPEHYWREALCRDPRDSRTNNAMGLWHLRRAEFLLAADHFAAAVERLTCRNPNPRDGEAFYNLGVARRFLGQEKDAYDAFYKATWNAAWRAPAYVALAEIDLARGEWALALDHAQRSLRAETDNLWARNLMILALRRLGRREEAEAVHRALRALDPLDLASRWADGQPPSTGQERLDLAFDLLRCGQHEEAGEVLSAVDPGAADGSLPMILLALAQVQRQQGLRADAAATRERARSTPLTYAFPSRLEEFAILEASIRQNPDDAAPCYLLGNYLYDRRRHEEAIAVWQAAALLDPEFPTVWRNLGIALFNVRGDRTGARLAFDRALSLNPADGRVLYERDQLWKRTGEPPERRLAELLRFPALIAQRDDLSVELATLSNQAGRPAEALSLLQQRHFQPWEGGEGLVLAQYVRACLLLGQKALQTGRTRAALAHFQAALRPPENLSEAKHLLANQSDVYYWLGMAYEAAGQQAEARTWWTRATVQRGDFQQMAVRTVSDMTYWKAMAHLRLGERAAAHDVLDEICRYSLQLESAEPKIDYFATSLPAMLLFEEDLTERNRIQALYLRAQALCGLGRQEEANELLTEVIALDSNHAGAFDLLQPGVSLVAERQ